MYETKKILKLDHCEELVAQLDERLVALCANAPTPVRCAFPRSAKFFAEDLVRVSRAQMASKASRACVGGMSGVA